MSLIIDDLIVRYPQLTEAKGQIEACCELLINAFSAGNRLIVAGNGGSCSDAEHIAGELLKSFKIRRKMSTDEAEKFSAQFGEAGDFLAQQLEPALPCLTLNSHIGFITAFGNDASSECAYAQQLYAQAQKGDIFLGLTTSGNAKNIYYAMMVARMRGVPTVLLTGNGHGICQPLADLIISVPACDPYLVQELHLPIYHTICMVIEEHFYGK